MTSTLPQPLDQAATLLALADRCEREEASRELDVAIWHALRWTVILPMTLPWTSSLDAAVTLVPEGDWSWLTRHLWRAMDNASVWQGWLGGAFEAHARTPALALCAAALKARAAIAEQEQASTQRGDSEP